MIELKGLKKYYGDRAVLNIPGLYIPQKGIYAIIGPNGSGKSTLLSCLAGLLPYEGTVSLDGACFDTDKIAFLNQKPYLFSFSVLKNVELALRRYEKNVRKEKAMEYLRLTGADALCTKKGHNLSGGESKKVALARTLATERPILLLDEPTSEMDINAAPAIEEVILEYRRGHDATVLFTTHNIAQAIRLADTVIVLIDGEITYMGEPENLKMPQDSKTTEYLKGWAF